MLGTILLILLIIALFGGLRDWGRGPFYGTGYYGGGGLASCYYSSWSCSRPVAFSAPK